MASAPAKNTNKDRTSSRLGRGLSSLIGAPVSVEPPATDAQLPVRKAPAPDVLRQQAELVRPSRPAAPEAAPVAAESDPDETFTPPDGRRLIYIPLDALAASPFQPRSNPADSNLAELARSIRESGVMQPIVVRERYTRDDPKPGARYELVAGERRWRASLLAGLNTIPAVVVVIDDRTAAEWALVENIQREDLNAVDRARAFRSLAETFELTHAQIAERVGLDRASVANAVRLTELEPAILDMLADNRLTAGHGKALLAAAPGAARLALAKRAHGEEWSVRTLEQHIRADSAAAANTKSGGGAQPSADAAKKERSAQVVSLEKQLSDHLSSKVRIKARPGANKGRIEIEFYDLDHFDALMDKLGFSAG
jgi:ParB family chromosome partitioning protein